MLNFPKCQNVGVCQNEWRKQRMGLDLDVLQQNILEVGTVVGRRVGDEKQLIVRGLKNY